MKILIFIESAHWADSIIESAHWADSIIESRCPSVYLSVYLSPSHAIFCVGELVHASLVRELVYASVAHEGWVQSVHRPRVHRPRVHLITRVEP